MTGIIKHSGALLVVGVDGAKASLTAMRWAVQQAPLYQASVLLIFVFDQCVRASYSGSPEVPACVSGDADRSAMLAAAELEAVRALTPDGVSSELIAGSPAKVLIDRSAGAKLLVLGTAYPPGDSAAAAPPPMGSVARACIRGAACPVVIVPHQWSCTISGSARQHARSTSPGLATATGLNR